MNTDNDHVILVDENDQVKGTAEKLAAHQAGSLHRAFSIALLRKHDNQLQTLLQQRHPAKYHCGGLWSNSCCSHPRPDESLLAAATRRLDEELGVSTDLTHIDHFVYKATLDNNLTEHELDHVYTGWLEQDVIPFNQDEIAAVRWVEINELEDAVRTSPDEYTPWLAQVLAIAKRSAV